jgi:helicase
MGVDSIMLIEELEKYGVSKNYIDLLKSRGISELNPIQSEAVEKGVFSRVNMVVSAPTASGKTLIAEMALVKECMMGFKGVYLTPLRALANEKYDEFKALESIGLRIGISTGDYDQPAEYLGEYDLVIATYERFDSIQRLKPTWLGRTSLVVIDELHSIMDPDRGPVIEMIAARALKHGLRIIGLSATIGNPGDLAEWLNAVLVSSNWRPVRLIEGVYNKKETEIVFQDSRVEAVDIDEGDSVVNLALHNLKNNHQTLVFIHNRKKVEEYARVVSQYTKTHSSRELSSIMEKLEEAPTRYERELLGGLIERGVGFHHAGLSHISRRVVEEAFRKRLLSIVFATPTLAAGVNLPARRVLVSIKRYDSTRGRRVNISVSEYKQMAGRAGRPRYDEVGEAIIIDASSVQEGFKYIHGSPEPVYGNLASDRGLRIHALSIIASEEARSIGELHGLLSKTFTAWQNPGLDLSSRVRDALRLLEDLKMVLVDGDYVRASRLGRLTSYTYLDPLSVSLFFKYKPRVYSEFYTLHLITLTPDFARSSSYIPEKTLALYEDLADSYQASNLTIPINTEYYSYDDWLTGFIHALALNDWINERSEDEIMRKYNLGPGDLYNMRDTASWIASSLGKIAGIMGEVEFNKKLLELSLRLEKGVKPDALELASLKYIGRVRARILIENGIKTLEDLAKTPRKKLSTLPTFGPRIAEEIQKQLRELGYKPIQ